jgi:hypothetical protein
MAKFEVMATVERDDETQFLSFYVDAKNAQEARASARRIVGGNPSVAVISEELSHRCIGNLKFAATR